MATTTSRAVNTRGVVLSTLVVLTMWIWGLASALFFIRWHSVERPTPPIRQIFPYGMMRVGVDASLPPFAVATREDLFGLDIDIAKEIGKRLNVPVQFINMGYDGLYDSLRADQVDVVISTLIIDPARTAEVRYSEPYFNAGLLLVSPSDTPLTTMRMVSEKRLAYEFGSAADSEARRWLRRIPPFTLMPYELPEYALDAVRLGEAEAALIDATSALLYFNQHPDWNANYVYVKDILYAAAVRADRFERWEVINNAIKAMKQDGTLEMIINRWLQQP